MLKTRLARVSEQLDARLQGLSEREADRLRDAFVRESGGGRTGRSRRSVVALLLALVILALYLLLALVGALLAVRVFTAPLNVLQQVGLGTLSAALLTFCVLARPRFRQQPGLPVSARQAPELHRLVAEVAGLLQSPLPRRVVLDTNVNAFMGLEGLPPRPVLGLGLPLLYGLTPQETVGLIAHELAHAVARDPARGQLVGTAVNVLHYSYAVIRPDDWTHLGFHEVLLNALRFVLSLPLLGLLWLMDSLMGEDSQRAEFRADLLEVQVAGSEAALSSLDKLHFAHLFEIALHQQRHRASAAPHAFAGLRLLWDGLSAEQRRQMRATAAQQRLRLDRSHPPTADRLAVIAAHPGPARLTVTLERWALIQAELAPFVPALEREATEEYQERYRA